MGYGLNALAEKGTNVVIEEPFKDLDIASNVDTYAVTLSHPVYRTPERTFSLGLSLELDRSKTFLLNTPFSFDPGAIDGKSNVTVIRLMQNWLDRSLNQVITARSTFSVGINAFGATVNDSLPDGQFLTWLGQFQWASRFGNRGYQALFRTDLQLANNWLLPLEKCAVGGASTVRGYRENLMVRDNCWITSLEFRLPVFRLPIPGLSQGPAEGLVQVAPFVDYGRAWNKSGPTLEPTSISSAGVGLRWGSRSQAPCRIILGTPFSQGRSAGS